MMTPELKPIAEDLARYTLRTHQPAAVTDGMAFLMTGALAYAEMIAGEPERGDQYAVYSVFIDMLRDLADITERRLFDGRGICRPERAEA